MNIVAPSLVPNLQECAILLDVDGTILDLAPTPPEVWVPPSLRQAIARLTERTGGGAGAARGGPLRELRRRFFPLLAPGGGGSRVECVAPGRGGLALRV